MNFTVNTRHTRCMNQARSTVSVVGAGHVGAAVANALVLLRECDQVVLHDRDLELAEGEAWDIADTVPLLSEMEVTPAAGYADLGGCDVVVITAGVMGWVGVPLKPSTVLVFSVALGIAIDITIVPPR